MSAPALEHARALIAQLARGAPVLDALHDEALTLLDEHEDALDPAWLAFLEDVRFLFPEITTTRSPKDRQVLVTRLVAAARRLP